MALSNDRPSSEWTEAMTRALDLEHKTPVPDEAPEGRDVGEAPCVFCGKVIGHVNDGGDGCVAGAVVNGEVRYFLYCNHSVCPERKKADAEGWGVTDCSCEDYRAYDVVGPVCHVHGGPPLSPKEAEPLWAARKKAEDLAEANREPCRRKTWVALVYACEYDPERFRPTNADGPRGMTSLDDVAHFGTLLEDGGRRGEYDPFGPEGSGYRLTDVTSYTLESLLLDVRDGKYKDPPS